MKLIKRQHGQIMKDLEKREMQLQKQGVTMSQQERDNFVNDYIPQQDLQNHLKQAFRLENLLKNICIRKLVKIREIKNKKSLKESVQLILKQNQEAEAIKRRKLKKKIIRQYEQVTVSNLQEKD